MTFTMVALMAGTAHPSIPALVHSPAGPVVAASGDRNVLRVEPDGHGRLSAPVMINGKGPFRLIVDSGANRSAVTPAVAKFLGSSSDSVASSPVHGVTGDSLAAMVKVESMTAGQWSLPNVPLPVVREAVAGEDGYLGLAGLGGGTVIMDLDRREMRIEKSGLAPLPATDRMAAELAPGGLLMFDVRVRGVIVKAIIDTGAEATIGNMAFQKALGIEPAPMAALDHIIGTGTEEQIGHTASLPSIAMGRLRISGARISFANLPVFQYFGLARVPAMLIGMDIVGAFSSVVFDYTNRTIQVQAHESG